MYNTELCEIADSYANGRQRGMCILLHRHGEYTRTKQNKRARRVVCRMQTMLEKVTSMAIRMVRL